MKKILVMFSVLVALCMTACAQGNSKNIDMDKKNIGSVFFCNRNNRGGSQ